MNVKRMVILGLVLALYATAACVGLAFVYTGTKETIEGHEQRNLEVSLQEIFPDSDDYEDVTGEIISNDASVTFSNQYVMKKDGMIIGAAIQASAGSYGGPIVSLVGIDLNGKITGVKILQNTDTPGLGAKASSANYFVDRANGVTFYGQFAGKSAGDNFAVKDDVAAITASTITSNAVASSVKAATRAGAEWLEAQGGAK
jgi:electron transport complex protein RnfG